jgi:hypothetical protein
VSKRLAITISGAIAPAQIDFGRPPAQPSEAFMIEIAISCDMSQYLGYK